MTFSDLLVERFSAYGELTGEQIGQLERHYNLLIRWNKRLNLTRIESLEDAVLFHYCESLFLGSKLPLGRIRIVDVGSGAGFPGFPVSVIRPEAEVTLVECHQRKGVFLSEVASGSPRIKVVVQRAELLPPLSFDWVVSRAVQPSGVIRMGLAPQSALLVGSADSEGFAERAKTPWGDDRFLVKGTVSRETSP